MNKKKVLVVGGAGYIGSHVNEMLQKAHYDTVVLDNLSKGNRKAVTKGTFIQGDMGDAELLDQIFSNHSIDVVMHFAALIDVGESVISPLKYYINNVAKTLTLLDAMQRHGIKILIFSSTAAIFGNPLENPINESHPQNPINPYGASKLMVENILQDVDRAHGIRSCSLRYFNAAGGDPEGKIKFYQQKPTNLIPIILKTILHSEGSVTIFGSDYPTLDGTCVRDYIHIVDLAAAHITAMEKLLAGSPSCQYNLGNGLGFSVREVISTVQKVTGKFINVIEGPRRDGDPAFLVANSAKAKQELQWNPRYPDLETMISHAWNALKL